mgnify:CR=1 FL=1
MAKLIFRIQSDWEEVVRLRNEIAKLKQELMSMDGTQSPAAFKALNAQLAASNQRLDELVTNAAKAGAEMETGFKRKIFDASQVVNGLSEKITFQRGTIQQLKNELAGLKDKYREALKQDGDTSSLEAKIRSTNKKLKEQKSSLFNLTQEQANARLSVKKLRDEYALYRQDGEKNVDVTKQVEQAMSNMGKKLLGGYSIKEFLSSMIRVRGEFQSMQTAIETMVGKDMAGQLIPQIKELAKISPLTMSDMVGAEKMMLGFNIQAEDTIKYLKAISDISMGESSKFNSLTLAFSQMSAAGKLMGQDLNQMINAGFNPLQIISEKTGKSIATLKDEMSKGAVSAEMVQQAFIDATSAGGKFYNMSENASKTINGQLSMMQDALDSVFNELGIKSESVIMDGIQMTTSLIQNYETVGKVLAGLVVTYGTYRTAVMLVTAAENGHSAATMVMRGRILLAQKAQALLNATMLKNPYVLLATVAIGAASAIWALSKRTTEAQEVQERYNASKENTIRKEEAHRQEIQRLISVASDEVEATANRNSAIEALKKAYPGIIEKYIDEEGHLTNLIQLQKELNEEQSKKKAESNQARLDAINAKVRNQEEYVLRISGSEEAIKEANDVLKELQRQQKEAQAAVNSDYINARIEEAKKLSDIELKKSISQWKSSLSKVTGDIIGDFSRDEVSSFIKSLESILYAREKQTKNKKYWEKQKKEAETALNSIASSQKKLLDTGKFKGIDDAVVNNYKDNVRKLKEAEKELKVYDSSSKQENQSPKEVTKQLKQQEQLAEQLLSIRRKNQQDEINLMEDGTERKLKQIDLDYQRELDAIRKQEQEWSKANGGKLTKEQSVQISLSYSQAENKRDKSISDLNKEKFESDKKAWQEYFIEFGNYQEKRKNLVQKYDDEIAKLHTDSPEYAIKVAEKNQAVEQLDEQFGHSAKAMADLFEDAGNKSVSAIQTIIDKYETLVKYMSGTKESDGTNVTLDELKALGFTDKDIEKIEKGEISIKDVTDAIRGLKDELKGKSPWQAFVSDLEKGIEAIKKGGNDSKKVGQGITDIGNAVTSFAPALGEFGTNIANIFGASDSAITGITDALGGLGTTAAGVGQIMSGDIVGGAMSAVSGISSVVSALDGLFGADYSHYNEMVEQYSLLNDIWDELIDKKLEYINTSYGAEANKVGEEALELAEKSIESYRILGKERLNAGSSAGSHSIGVRIRKGMSEQGWEEARKALNDEQWFKEISTGRMESLFDLSTEQLERLKSEAPTFWAKLDEDVRNYLDKIIDGEERIEEIHNQINEQLTQTTFDGVYSNFIDTLMDMKASSKDAAEDISEYFMRAMLSEQIGTLYQDKLKKWYEKFAKDMEDGSLTESERNALNAEYMGYIEEAMKLRDELAAATGYDKISQESYSQSSSSRGFGTEMTHEDAGELSGRFTALQIAGEEIKFQSIIQSQSLNLLTVKADALLSINTETRNIADDTRDLIAQSYLELVQISENTGAIVKPIQQMQRDIAEVKKNTAKL